MDSTTKIYIGVGVVVAGVAYYLYSRSKTAAAAPALAPVQKNAGVFSPTSPAPSPGKTYGPISFGTTIANIMAPTPVAPPSGGAPAPAPMPTITTPSTGPMTVQQFNLTMGRAVNGPGGVYTWGSGAVLQGSTIWNSSKGPVGITTPSGALTLSSNMTYDVSTQQIGF